MPLAWETEEEKVETLMALLIGPPLGYAICTHTLTMLLLSSLLLLFATLECDDAVRCHQCSGWQGDYPLRTTSVPTCDNLNNQCNAENFCVKIVNPMKPGVGYATYKADCWKQNNLQVTPSNSVTVVSGECYDYQDGANPSNRYQYCFCNNKDYCNSVSRSSLLTGFLFPFAVALLLFSLHDRPLSFI